ncbi:MAG: hypothetical protein ACU84H_08870 [Gammaproteobacteria bacterium]
MDSIISKNEKNNPKGSIPIFLWVLLWCIWIGLSGFVSGFFLPVFFSKSNVGLLIAFFTTPFGTILGLFLGLLTLKVRHIAKVQFSLFLAAPLLFAAGIAIWIAGWPDEDDIQDPNSVSVPSSNRVPGETIADEQLQWDIIRHIGFIEKQNGNNNFQGKALNTRRLTASRELIS